MSGDDTGAHRTGRAGHCGRRVPAQARHIARRHEHARVRNLDGVHRGVLLADSQGHGLHTLELARGGVDLAVLLTGVIHEGVGVGRRRRRLCAYRRLLGRLFLFRVILASQPYDELDQDNQDCQRSDCREEELLVAALLLITAHWGACPGGLGCCLLAGSLVSRLDRGFSRILSSMLWRVLRRLFSRLLSTRAFYSVRIYRVCVSILFACHGAYS